MGDIFDAAGKNTNLNHFKSNILYEAIEYPRLDFEDTRDINGGMSNPKRFYKKNGLDVRIVSTTTYRPGKTVVVHPYHIS